MSRADFSGILQLGGTILGSSRVNPMKREGGLEECLRNLRGARLDALVAIGGDDTLSVASWLAQQGAPVVGVPKTMDNDLSVTDYCIGFDSAVSIVTEALDRLHSTAASHHRVMVVEVMGRDTGWVAVMGGLAGGADMIIIPEFPLTLDEVVAHLDRRRAQGSDFSIIVVAEGVQMDGVTSADDGGRHGRVRPRSAEQARSRREPGGDDRAAHRPRDAHHGARPHPARRQPHRVRQGVGHPRRAWPRTGWSRSGAGG